MNNLCFDCKATDTPLTMVYSKVGRYHYCEDCVEKSLLSGEVRHRRVEILVRGVPNANGNME